MAVVATTPALAETLARDWQKATGFYARFGITEAMFRYGAPSLRAERDDAFDDVTALSLDGAGVSSERFMTIPA